MQPQKISATKAFLLSLPDYGERVFQHFGIDPHNSAKQPAPSGYKGSPYFDADGIPRISFWSAQDPKTGNPLTAQTALGLVKFEKQLSTAAAIDYIAKVYDIDAATIKKEASQIVQVQRNGGAPSLPTQPHKRLNPERVLAEIRYREIPTPAEIAFVTNKTAGIVSADDLSRFGVRSVEYVHELLSVAGRPADDKKTGLSHYYAFPSGIEGYTKFITPLRKNSQGERMKSKFVTNLAGYEERGRGRRYCFGLDTLSGEPYVIFTEGEWECLILKALGYNACTFGGVSSFRFDDSVVRQLKGAGVNRCLALFDTDEPGEESARRFASQSIEGLTFGVCRIPKLDSIFTFDAKDLCDYVQAFGFDDDIRAVIDYAIHKQPAPYRHGLFERRGVSVPYREYTVTKYVSEIADEIEEALQETGKVILSAPTGAGKTFLSLRLAQEYHRRTGARVAIVMPTQIGVSQVVISANEERGRPGNEHYKEVFGISSIEGLDELSRMQARSAAVVASTYDSIDAIGLVGFLIIDEQHLLADSFEYRASAVRKVFSAIEGEGIQRILAISATPETLLCKIHGFRFIKCDAIDKIRYQVSQSTIETVSTLTDIRRRSDSLKVRIAAEIQDVIRCGRLPVVRFDDKEGLDILADYLRSIGFTSGVYRIDSDNKDDNETNGAWQSIVHKQALPEGTRVVLSTRTLDTAVSIRGTGHEIIIVNETRADAIAQFAARFRDESSVRIRCIYSKLGEESTPANASAIYEHLTEDARVRAYLCNQYEDQSSEFVRVIMELDSSAKRSGTVKGLNRVRRQGAGYVTDFVACYAEAVQKCRERSSADCLRVLRAFNEFGMMCIDVIQAGEVLAVDALKVLESIDRITARSNDRRAKIVEIMGGQDYGDFLDAVYGHTKDKSLIADIPAIADQDGFRVSREENQGNREYRNQVSELVKWHGCAKMIRLYCVLRTTEKFDHTSAVVILNLSTQKGSNGISNIRRSIGWLRLIETDWQHLTGLSKVTQEAIQTFRDKFEPGKSYSGAEIRRAAEIVRIDGLSIVSDKIAVPLFKTIFGCDSRRGAGMKYAASAGITVADYCERLGIRPPDDFKPELVQDTDSIRGGGGHTSLYTNKRLREMCEGPGPKPRNLANFEGAIS